MSAELPRICPNGSKKRRVERTSLWSVSANASTTNSKVEFAISTACPMLSALPVLTMFSNQT